MMEYFKRLPGLTTPAVVDLAHTIPLRRAQVEPPLAQVMRSRRGEVLCVENKQCFVERV